MTDATILIVDDNPTNLAVLSEAIAPAGWEVLVAIDGASSIEQAAYANPDLILLDVMMPQLDGFETCSRLKQNPKTEDIPVIFMTALNDANEKVKGLSLGAVDYITKPFNKEEVIARVKIHLKLRQLTQTLEQKVDERTKQLNQTVEQLKQSQLQVIQSEKLSSLGQLVAGIGHEINNPISFVDGNLEHLEDYIDDLIEHLDLYEEEIPESPTAVAEHAEDIDLPYLREDLPQVLQSMRVGTQRIVNISHSLRVFARADQTNKVLFNVEDGLKSTLLILNHRLKANNERPEFQIHCDFGNVPELKCYPGQLNQVFMNLLANAIDALDEQIATAPTANLAPQITIRTSQLDEKNCLKIQISDNGPGMSAQTQAQVFDYMFTTKPVGKGTGLGLSICQQIIAQQHGGKLTVQSELGQGTTFTIVLPLNGDEAL
ncbi:MAG: response regulator [Spirulina sp. SIO3F2]|nr:response regulator [Spirulina sp. SIO3F2]